MGKILKELNGHSGSQVLLMEDDTGLWVRKIKNTERNVERLTALYKAGYPVPKILSYDGEVLDMEYLHGLDMKNYLIHNTSTELQKFIICTLDNFSLGRTQKDYTLTYNSRLMWMDQKNPFSFSRQELVDRLPKLLPKSNYHGDMTLENIMYTNSGFYMIDGMTSDYDSYVFDIAKMRQDLECKWFLRNSDAKLDFKLQNIQDTLRECYPEAFDDSLLILMLLRVYVHCKEGDKNSVFVFKHVERLWKNIR